MKFKGEKQNIFLTLFKLEYWSKLKYSILRIQFLFILFLFSNKTSYFPVSI